MTGPASVTDAMVERAIAVLWHDPDLPGMPPCSVRAGDYLRNCDQYADEDKAPGGRREADMARFLAAEYEAARMNRDAMRKALEAALDGGIA